MDFNSLSILDALSHARRRAERDGTSVNLYVSIGGARLWVRSASEGPIDADPLRPTVSWFATVVPQEDGGTITQWAGHVPAKVRC